LKVDKLNR
jgi:coiled-coil domain-containing protein 40